MWKSCVVIQKQHTTPNSWVSVKSVFLPTAELPYSLSRHHYILLNSNTILFDASMFY